MKTDIFSNKVKHAVQEVVEASQNGFTKTVTVNGIEKSIPYPFPSPADWRDCWIYFLMTDRFNNPSAEPKSLLNIPPLEWDAKYDFRQGGTFKGIQEQLDYIASLGANAIWISPVVKNFVPDSAAYTYPGYSTQDFLTIDGRFASDGTSETAEQELIDMVNEAHARGLYVILDIVINHATRAFDYKLNGTVTDSFSDEAILNGPLGDEPPIEWLDGSGNPRPDWLDNLPPAGALSPDDAVWPSDLHRKDFFRRRGSKISDTPGPNGFAAGDFGVMRQLVVEYTADAPEQKPLRELYGRTPVLSILIHIYQYLIAQFDIDGFRIDTVKYVDPEMVEVFGNAMREFALSIGKKNFFTFGEIYDDEGTIARFVGRNSTQADGFGIDAALDFPLFFTLPGIAKGNTAAEALQNIFKLRKTEEKNLLSSHGEAGKYFVSFLDNHDQNQRFNHPLTPKEQVLLGVATLFCLQGIPCLYYGTEQGLNGAKDKEGNPDLNSLESVREALWGKKPVAFDRHNFFYKQVQLLSKLRRREPALRYGRLYFRKVSGNGQDFGFSTGAGGLIAFSRILNDREILIVANTNTTLSFSGSVLLDIDLNRSPKNMKVAYSNVNTEHLPVIPQPVKIIEQANIYEDGQLVDTAEVAALPVNLAAMEVQILVPEEV